MNNHYALEFTELPSAVLFEKDQQNTWGSWSDFIVIEKESNGTFNVLARKYADELLDGPSEMVWIEIDSVKSINDPEKLLNAIHRCEMTLNVEIDWEYLLESLSKLDTHMSTSLSNLNDNK